jgi:hypothetical protein
MFLAKKLNKGAGSPTVLDAQFNYVTMLLHGDGTNGAQNNTFLDSSTNNFSITRNGNTTQGSFSPYGSNWSNYFNGSTDWLTTGSSVTALGSGNWTVEFWFYATVTSATQVISDGRSSGQGYYPSFYINSANKAVFFTNSADILVSTNTVSTNVWTHVAFVKNSTTTTCYINGVANGTYTDTNTYLAGVTTFGASGLTVDSHSAKFTGYISNYRIVVGTAVYTSAFTPPTTPLTAVTNTALLICQSNCFIDNSTNNNTIIPSGTPSVQRFNPFGASTAYSTSVIGGSGYFDGSGDYLTAPDNTAFNFGSGSFTIEMWIYPTGTGVAVLYSKATADFNGVIVAINNGATGRISFYADSTGSGPWEVLLDSTKNVSLNAWSHIACVRNSNTWTIYINGVASGTTTSSITPTNQAVGPSIGFFYSGLPANYQGYISDSRVNKGTAVYTSNFTPPTTPLTAISGTSLLINMTNGAIFDNAMMNDLETLGNAQISTSVKKYGTGSLAFDGTGDYLISNSPTTDLYAFGIGDFTIEFWLYLNSTSGAQVFYDGRPASSQGLQPTIYTNSGTLYYYTNATNRITGNSLSTNTWYHIAVSRSGSSTKMFVNGTQVGSTYTDSTNYINSALRPMIGADGYNSGTPGGNPMNGYIDDLRITKGYARYTTTFTPPTAAFPNTGPV